MVVDALITALVAVLGFFKGLIPDWAWLAPLGDPVHFPVLNGGGVIWSGGNLIRQVVRWIAGFNDILPVSEAAAIGALVLTVFGVIMAIRTGKWAIGVIRGSGTS